MNKERRAELSDIVSDLEGLADSLQAIGDEEMDAFDNLPDGLKESDRGLQMTDYVDLIDVAADKILAVGQFIEKKIINNR